jgi:hypothetical protein
MFNLHNLLAMEHEQYMIKAYAAMCRKQTKQCLSCQLCIVVYLYIYIYLFGLALCHHPDLCVSMRFITVLWRIQVACHFSQRSDFGLFS